MFIWYNKSTEREVTQMLKWWKRYKFCKMLGIKHPLKASLDKKFIR